MEMAMEMAMATGIGLKAATRRHHRWEIRRASLSNGFGSPVRPSKAQEDAQCGYRVGFPGGELSL